MTAGGVIPPPEERSPYVRPVGEVFDMDECRLPAGVDHDTVTIGGWCFTLGQVEELAHHIAAACWEAGANAARMRAEVSDGG
jgi:hypothetical protein